MDEILGITKIIVGAIGGYVGMYLGGYDGFLYMLLILVTLDYITGVLAALKVKKNFSSEVGFWGLVKKILMFALVGVGVLIDSHIIGAGAAFRNMIIFFFAANEGLSMVENLAVLDILVPDKLKEALAQLKDDGTKMKK